MMTRHLSDEILLDGENFLITQVCAEGMFDPNAHGISTQSSSSACWRGYQATYEILNGRVYLIQVHVSVEYLERIRWKQGKGRALFGVEAIEGPDAFDLSYTELRHPVAVTGGLLLGAGRSRSSNTQVSDHPAWRFQTLIELRVDAGKLLSVTDHTSRMDLYRNKHFSDPFPTSTQKACGDAAEGEEDCVELEYSLEEGLRFELRSERKRKQREAVTQLGKLKVNRIHNGFVQCPYCGTHFALYSKRSWDGVQHLSCGAELILPAEDLTERPEGSLQDGPPASPASPSE